MKTLKVLIVDDSLTDIQRASGLLRKAGHTILVAKDGKEGVELAKKELPDLILMDVVMPNLNGFQATRQLGKDELTKDIPVIVVSGKDQETDKIWALRQGAKAYLIKEVEQRSLLETIERVVN